MKYLNLYNKFFESSQSKKIKKYVGFSVVLQWYRENKTKIAELLHCDVNNLSNEDTLMKQSYYLINNIINNQTGGNSGITDTEIVGFDSFKRIENNLIHDILHNIFNVKTKEFNKSLSDIQFTESEIIEEIECLAIEESFMKYMNITYLKTDFINANINQLASYLMMAIIKNDPDRIEKILNKEIEPYLEVYGKKYPIKGTPFENFFDLFENKEADSKFKIKNAEDFKHYMIHLINVGIGIGDSSGDRAQYPDNEYYGPMSFHDLSNEEQKYFIQSNFDDMNIRGNTYLLLDNFDDDITKFKFDYTVIGYGKNIFNEKVDKTIKIEIDDKLQNLMQRIGFDEHDIKRGKNFAIKLYPNDIKYDTGEIRVNYQNELGKILNGYIKVDNIPNYLQPQLKLEAFNFRYSLDNFKNSDYLDSLPIKMEFIDKENKTVFMDEWFKFLEEFYNINIIYKAGDTSFIGIKYIETTVNVDIEGKEVKNSEEEIDVRRYTIMNTDSFMEKISDYYNDGDSETFSNDHKFIDFKNYQEKTFSEIVKSLFYDNDSVAILRRNFRLSDTIVNNTKLGTLGNYDLDKDENTKKIKTKNPLHNYLDFSGSYRYHNEEDGKISISKSILTDNGKKLKELLDNFRGYVITNFNRIKKDFNKGKNKFTKNDIDVFKKLNKNILNVVDTINLNELIIDFYIYYNGHFEKNIKVKLSENLQILLNFYKKFEDVSKLNNLIKNKDDINYLKNFVNLNGDIKITKDYFDFKRKIAKISKKDIFKFKEILNHLDEKDYVELESNYIDAIQQLYEKEKYNENGEDVITIITNILKTTYPELKYRNIEIVQFDSISLIFKINIDI